MGLKINKNVKIRIIWIRFKIESILYEVSNQEVYHWGIAGIIHLRSTEYRAINKFQFHVCIQKNAISYNPNFFYKESLECLC